MTNLFRNKYLIPSTRLCGYDYSQAGYYFVTICTKNRYHYFGNIIDNKMNLNDIGKIANHYWLEIPQHFPHVTLDEFVVMPNHVHGIIITNELRGGGIGIGRDEALPRLYNGQYPKMSAISPKPGSLSVIVGSYKSIVTKTINQKYVNNYFTWQPRFYDHIIRNEKSLHNIQQYIFNNPQMWNRDKNNPDGLLM